MKIIGGTYFESVLDRGIESVWGSGFRAAASLSFIADVCLHTYVGDDNRDVFDACAKVFDIDDKKIISTRRMPYFQYESSVLPPRVRFERENVEVITVESKEAILCFGMMESQAVVHGGRVVYDPQSPYSPCDFFANGSSANELAVVLNVNEAIRMFGVKYPEGINEYFLAQPSVSCVIVKQGPAGALVIERNGNSTRVPAYRTNHVFAVGTGDVFSAFFAYLWADQKESAVLSAMLASKAVALYVERAGVISEITRQDLASDSFRSVKWKECGCGLIYLAGPFFTIAEKKILEMFKCALNTLNVPYFSPIDEVGIGDDKVVCAGDLDGLKRSSTVLANICGMDVGSIFEIGYARAQGIPVVAFGQNLKASDLTMITGSDCFVTSDFTSAVYNSVWNAIENG